MLTLLAILVMILSYLLIMTFLKLKKVEKEFSLFKDEIEKNFNIRKGFILKSFTHKVNKTDTDFKVYMKEIERYKNGLSKVELEKIELIKNNNVLSDKNIEILKNNIKREFSQTQKTDDVEWLEVEVSIKNERKKKLNKILNNK